MNTGGLLASTVIVTYVMRADFTVWVLGEVSDHGSLASIVRE